MALAHERFQKLPQELKREFTEILHSVPACWHLNEDVAVELANATSDFIIDWVNKYTESIEDGKKI